MNDEPSGRMSGATDDAIRELLALAAVGALSAAEQADIDAILASRPDLRAELAELQDAAATLAAATAESPPPPLRASVLAAVRDLPQEPTGVRPGVYPSTSQEPATATPGVVVPISARRQRRWVTAATAAAAVAAAVIAVLVLAPFDGSDGLEVADVVGAENVVTIELAGDLSGLRLVHSPDHGAVALVGDGVAAPDGDDVYELWLIDGSTHAPVETFRPDDDGQVEVLMPDMTPPPGAAFAITIEPPGGSDQPTGEVVASSV